MYDECHADGVVTKENYRIEDFIIEAPDSIYTRVNSVDCIQSNVDKNKNMHIPNLEEYNKALNTVKIYEAEKVRLENIKLTNFREDLKAYFSINKIAGERITSFTVDKCWIGESYDINVMPFIDGYYCGKNNKDIELLCEKHDIVAHFSSNMYPK